MINTLDVYYFNNAVLALDKFIQAKQEICDKSYDDIKNLHQSHDQTYSRLSECLWLLQCYQEYSDIPVDQIRIDFPKNIEVFYTYDITLKTMPDILKKALDEQIKNFDRQKTLKGHADAIEMRRKQAQKHKKNLRHLKKIPKTSSLKRRPINPRPKF
jgi:glycyl-tRNA synthetase alpha subunit